MGKGLEGMAPGLVCSSSPAYSWRNWTEPPAPHQESRPEGQEYKPWASWIQRRSTLIFSSTVELRSDICLLFLMDQTDPVIELPSSNGSKWFSDWITFFYRIQLIQWLISAFSDGLKCPVMDITPFWRTQLVQWMRLSFSDGPCWQCDLR